MKTICRSEAMSAEPPYRDLHLWVGNTESFMIRFGAGNAPLDLSGSEIVLAVQWQDGSMRKQAGVDAGIEISDALRGEVTIQFSADETRLFPASPYFGYALYAIERRIASERKTILHGKIIPTEWKADGDA